jgi:hypothetical protein
MIACWGDESRLRADVRLPVSVQGSLLDFLFAQEEIQRCGIA